MKKIIAFLSAVTFLGSSTLAVSACGVSKGQQIEIKINNAPKEAESKDDPLVDYVYNNKYAYNVGSVNYLIALATQLASDKIYYDNQKNLNSELWKEFYQTKEWRSGYFSSFNYDLSDITLPGDEQDFSFKANNNQDLIYQINNNDATDDNNKLRIYWFITSPEPWVAGENNSYKPTKSNITIPKLSEFNEENETITRTGFVHFYSLIGTFKIDFNVEINFNFDKVIDKNGIPVVILNLSTFSKPLGDIKFDDVEEAANNKISEIAISKAPVDPEE